MANRNRPLVPGARDALDKLKQSVITDQVKEPAPAKPGGWPLTTGPATAKPAGWPLSTPPAATNRPLSPPTAAPSSANSPQPASTAGTSPSTNVANVAKKVGVPYNEKDNGDISARQAGKIGGHIGGPMVQRLIEIAERELSNTQNKRP